MKLAIGDRVQTPEGPGTVVGTVERTDRFYRPPRTFVYVLVEPDSGPHVRQWRLAELSVTRGEHEAEARAVEDDQFRRHGESPNDP